MKQTTPVKYFHSLLVGGFNPLEKYWSKWESSPNRDEHLKKHTTQFKMDRTWMSQEVSKWLLPTYKWGILGL